MKSSSLVKRASSASRARSAAAVPFRDFRMEGSWKVASSSLQSYGAHQQNTIE
jgi:hypothetical protein